MCVCVSVFVTRKGLLGLTAELPDAAAVAVALVHHSMDGLVPGLSDLKEGSGLGLLALVWNTRIAHQWKERKSTPQSSQ